MSIPGLCSILTYPVLPINIFSARRAKSVARSGATCGALGEGVVAQIVGLKLADSRRDGSSEPVVVQL